MSRPGLFGQELQGKMVNFWSELFAENRL